MNLDEIVGPEQEESIPEFDEQEEYCLYCGADLSDSTLYRHYGVCHECRFHHSVPAWHRIALIADEGSFREINRFLTSIDPLSFSGKQTYGERIQEAQLRTGLTEAVITGVCTIGGNPVALAVLDFGFMGGNMGGVVGEKVALTFELAALRKIPVITVVSSGGTRIQEGMLSLMQMAKTAAAVKRHHRRRVPYISILTNPTSGEVYGSFASLGDIILAEPGALVGFAPLRVIEETSPGPLPQGFHTAEYSLEHGMIDKIVDRSRLRPLLATILDLFNSSYRLTSTRKGRPYRAPEHLGEGAWETVQIARHRERPTALDYITRVSSSFIELHGDRNFADDRAIVGGIAELSGEAVVIIGHQRDHRDGFVRPEGVRKAYRLMRLAALFGLPVITLIDTPGAHPGIDSEERGIGHAIASSLAFMSDLPVPVVSVIIGQGGSAGALAMGVADRILMQENAIYSIISPESAASIIYGDTNKAGEMAAALKLTAVDCKDLEVIDVIVPEPEGGAHSDPDEAARLLRNAVVRALLEVEEVPRAKLIKERYKKYRRMGEFSSYFRAAVAREVADLQNLLKRGVSRLRKTFSGVPRVTDSSPAEEKGEQD